MNKVFITGANRGIGLELVQQCLQRGDKVFASCRNPDQATHLIGLRDTYSQLMNIIHLDVTDQAGAVTANISTAPTARISISKIIVERYLPSLIKPRFITSSPPQNFIFENQNENVCIKYIENTSKHELTG